MGTRCFCYYYYFFFHEEVCVWMVHFKYCSGKLCLIKLGTNLQSNSFPKTVHFLIWDMYKPSLHDVRFILVQIRFTSHVNEFNFSSSLTLKFIASNLNVVTVDLVCVIILHAKLCQEI